MVETAGALIQEETGNPEQDQHISEQGPINMVEVSTTTSTEGDAPSMSQVYWDKNDVWQYWGGCWWKETSTGWWEKWRDTAGQQ